MTLQKRRRCNVLLRRLLIRCCNDAVFATSSDISIATLWRRQSNVGQRCRNNFVTTSLCLLGKTSSRCLPGDVLKTSCRRHLQDVFQETFSRRLPGDVLKTSLRRLKIYSRLFLVNAKDHLETTYELSIQVRFKLLTYCHSITKQTK